MPPIVKFALFAGAVALFFIAAALLLGSGALGDTASELANTSGTRPGIGIRSLSFVNLLLAYALGLMILDRLPIWQRLGARFQGVITLLLTLLGAFAAIVAAFAALQFLLLMVAVLTSGPFGALAYFALWGDFDTDASRALLAIVMTLQMSGVIAALIVNHTLLKNLRFLLLGGTVLLLTVGLGLLHALPPSFLVSIADAIGAIVACIVAAVWMLLFLLSSLFTVAPLLRGLARA